MKNGLSALSGKKDRFVFSSDHVLGECRALASEYPALEMGSAGKSVMEKDLTTLRIGSGKRRLLFCASYHANEWLTSLVLLRFIRDLCRHSDTSRYDALFVPLVNPDGADLVTGALKNGAYYNKAKRIASHYPSVPFPDGWKANINGVDLNLQYPARWETAKKLKYELGFSSPAPRDFVGTAPLSQPESRALAALTESFMPDAAISLHSQGRTIYYRHAGAAPKGAKRLGEMMAAASGYKLEETPPESDNAGYKDWVISAYGIPAYTAELGLGSNPLPISRLDDICLNALPMLRVFTNGV